jgi:predicted nucleotidyltransferase
MTISQELKHAVRVAQKHGVGKLYLVGSALHPGKKPPQDLDFAVADVPPGTFFKFYGELLLAVSRRVDLIDLSGARTKFKTIVLKEARLLYDKSAA